MKKKPINQIILLPSHVENQLLEQLNLLTKSLTSFYVYLNNHSTDREKCTKKI